MLSCDRVWDKTQRESEMQNERGANRSCETTFKEAETNHMKNTIYVESAWNHMGPNLICFSWDHKHGSSSVILKCFRGTCWPNSFSCFSSLLAWNITTACPTRSLKRNQIQTFEDPSLTLRNCVSRTFNDPCIKHDGRMAWVMFTSHFMYVKINLPNNQPSFSREWQNCNLRLVCGLLGIYSSSHLHDDGKSTKHCWVFTTKKSDNQLKKKKYIKLLHTAHPTHCMSMKALRSLIELKRSCTLI